MRTLASLLTLALVCGVCRPDPHTATHFKPVYSWSGIDFAYTTEHPHDASVHTGTAIPFGVDVDPVSGRMFLSFLPAHHGLPASFGVVSEATNDHGDHLVEPYPNWTWHNGSCDSIIAVEKFKIDECGRLWVMDTGSVYTKGYLNMPEQKCPPKLLVFKLSDNTLIKSHTFHADFVNDDSTFSTVLVDVHNKADECKDTFVYVADAGGYTIIVYDFAKDDSWLVEANEMYPYPEHGRFDIKGYVFDFMYGIYSMALSPLKDSTTERTLYFNSLSSATESHVLTSVLENKTNFVDYNHAFREFVPFPHQRPHGPTGSEVMDDNGVMFFNSVNDMKVYCWNHETEYAPEHFVEVDSDDEAFQLFADMKLVKKDGVTNLYILTNNVHKFMFQTPSDNHVYFRVMKASVDELIKGTACVGSHHNVA